MTYSSFQNRPDYAPPMLSNGDISFAPDAEGTLDYIYADYFKKGIDAYDGIVVRAARRTALCNSLQARLFPFGKFIFREGSQLVEWSQTLMAEKGYVESDCLYESGTKIHSQSFIHPNANIYALQKTFLRAKGTQVFCYDIDLCGYSEQISRYMHVRYTRQQDNVGVIGFSMFGMDVFTGEIHVFVDKECVITATETGIQLRFEATEGEAVTFYYCVEDDWDGVDFSSVLAQYQSRIRQSGFDKMLEECAAHFGAYYGLGYVETSDEDLNRIYKTSLYSIKSNTTRYSIAVGFNNGSWDGRYFAFDEYTSFLGLLGANRLDLAKRVPLFRLKHCLPSAIRRASDCHRNADTEDMARFHWETGEVDRAELSPDGNWLDHVFHIPLVGIGAYNYYEYSLDTDFLRECYPMIRACAKFMTRHMVYTDAGRYYIGKCTDLERLGSSVENPFMTACGAICLLQCCAKAAEILETDEAYARECLHIAEKLLENLPQTEQMYVPHLGCRQKSIAVFAGKFPFPVLPDHDEKMLAAWEDFEINGAAYGNMYPWGGGISPWYACWKALGYARTKNPQKTYASLKQAYRSAGVFNELFEINEEKVRCRPWFATAAGIFVSAVNDMLLQVEDKHIFIMPACPHSVNARFKLAAKGGITVEADVQNGALLHATVLKNGIDVTDEYTITL